MAKIILISLSIFLIAGTTIFTPGNAQSSCNGPCKTLDDCAGQLICINGKCSDDPQVGTHTCGSGGGGGGGGGGGKCSPSGTLHCSNRKSYPQYTCSPLSPPRRRRSSPGMTSARAATVEVRRSATISTTTIASVVALSTGWYAGGSRCGRRIRIVAGKGRSTTAKVVDECDSRDGCDKEHAGQPPCDNDIVDGSDAVWKALGLDVDIGVVPVTWSMA